MKTEIIWATDYDLPAGWPMLGHRHDFYQLMYVAKGDATLYLDGKACPLPTGSCAVIPPEYLHEIPAEEHSLLETLELKFILIDPDISALLKDSGPLISHASVFADKAIRYIVCNWPRRDPAIMSFMDSFLCSLLLSIYLEREMAEGNVSAYIETDSYSPKVRQVIHCVEQNLTEPFRLDELAQKTGLNKRYLCTLFRKETGLTISQYLDHIRIRQAATDLYYHDVPISIIGQRVGFASHSSFSRMFKRLVGISPSEYRDRYMIREDWISSGGMVSHLEASNRLLGVGILPLADSVRYLRRMGGSGPGNKEPS